LSRLVFPTATEASFGYAINAAGHVVGWARTVDTERITFHAFLYDGTMHDLGSFGPEWDSFATDINDHDVVVGYCSNGGSGSRAFRWEKGKMEDINDDRVGSESEAYGINNSGVIVGQCHMRSDDHRGAFVYSNGAMQDLNTLIIGPRFAPSLQWPPWLLWATDINDAGQIVGSGAAPTRAQRDSYGFLGFLLTPYRKPGPRDRFARELNEVVRLPRDPPPPDPGPLAQILRRVSDLPASQRDLVLGLIISELAGQVEDAEAEELQARATEIADRAAQNLSEEQEQPPDLPQEPGR
jgi:probable HAF family extracellular repeat protein